ncbi:MAG: DUF4124 domain-containing protein [Rhodanobacteraceae bacterium]|nr:DUF4124 domain-containing protein [Pseudomonadota bacterium]
MHVISKPIVIGALLLFAGGAVAQNDTPSTHYRWRDAAGGLHYSDAIPPGAVRFGYDVLNADGLLVRHVNRELTPQERAAVAAQTAQAAAVKRAADQQALADRQLIAAYPTEAELREAQQAKLAQLQQGMQTTRMNLRSQEQSLADLLAHAAELERSGKPVPNFMRERLVTQRASVTGERSAMAQMQRQIDATTQQFADELQRYRTLRAKMQSDMTPSN